MVNLYQFERAAIPGDLRDDQLIEEIDIGGPTLVRAAAKNHANVAIVTDPDDYQTVLAEIDEHGVIPIETRRILALKAFRRTAAYDAAIVSELAARWTPDDTTPEVVPLALQRTLELRYGENPHQQAALYSVVGADPAVGPFVEGVQLLQGKPLSYNNLLDASAVAAMGRDLVGHAVVIVKHGNPCGAAEADDLVRAWDRALEADPVSAFGGVVAVRGIVDEVLAERLTRLFLEVVVAEGFDARARAVLATKPDLRLLEDHTVAKPTVVTLEARAAGGAVLLITADVEPDSPAAWRTVTQRRPSEQERADLAFAWRPCGT